MRWMLSMVSGLTLALAAADSPGQGYPSPGFDCANATSPQELRICRSPRISEMDGLHWHLAERAIKGSGDPERTRADVEGWIAKVRNACETDACMVAAYEARNAELERAVAKLAPPPPLPAPRPIASPPPPLEKPKPPEAIPTPVTPLATATTAPPAAPAKPVAAAPPRNEEKEDAPLWPWFAAGALIVAALIAKR